MLPNRSPVPVTELLVQWRRGDARALDDLVGQVYGELRRVARFHLFRERPGHTLQSGALVHEAYLRMLGQQPVTAEDRAQFLSIAARLMRQILIDHARGRLAAKRGANQVVNIDVSLVVPQQPHAEVMAVDDALTALARKDEQQGKIVELRFFGGLSNEEVAEVLGISVSTVKRDWIVAKAWLARQIRKGKGYGSAAARQVNEID